MFRPVKELTTEHFLAIGNEIQIHRAMSCLTKWKLRLYKNKICYCNCDIWVALKLAFPVIWCCFELLCAEMPLTYWNLSLQTNMECASVDSTVSNNNNSSKIRKNNKQWATVCVWFHFNVHCTHINFNQKRHARIHTSKPLYDN